MTWSRCRWPCSSAPRTSDMGYVIVWLVLVELVLRNAELIEPYLR